MYVESEALIALILIRLFSVIMKMTMSGLIVI